MSTFQAVFREIFGLFVDDRGLALALLAVVAFAAVLVGLMPERQMELAPFCCSAVSVCLW
jgi:hypothetical protein